MQVNKFMTMAVGLIVGVLLIAGVVAPVIANVSSDGGGSAKSHTNTGGSEIYSLADENTNFSVYPIADHVISLQPDSVEDRVTYEIQSDYFIWFTELGNSVQFDFRERDGNMTFGGTYTMLSITGNTLTGYRPNGTSWVFEDKVLYYMDPLGSFINNLGWTYNEETDDFDGMMGTAYVFKDTPIYAEIDFYADDNGDYGDGVGSFYIYGSSINHHIGVDSDLDCEDHAIYTFTGDVLSSIGLTIDGVLYTVPIPPQGQLSGEPMATVNGMLIFLSLFIVPIEVAEESGDSDGGNGISPSLKTTLTVIPLVMTVGLVLGAVAFFRMKN